MGQVKDASSSEIVDHQSFTDGVVEVDTGGSVEDHFDLFNELTPHFWVEAKALKDEVTPDGDDSLADDLKKLRSSLEEGKKNFRSENLL